MSQIMRPSTFQFKLQTDVKMFTYKEMCDMRKQEEVKQQVHVRGMQLTSFMQQPLEFHDNMFFQDIIVDGVVVEKRLPHQWSTPNFDADMQASFSVLDGNRERIITGNGKYLIDGVREKKDGELLISVGVGNKQYVVLNQRVEETNLPVGRYEKIGKKLYNLDADWEGLFWIGLQEVEVCRHNWCDPMTFEWQRNMEGIVVRVDGLQFKWKRNWTVDMQVVAVMKNEICLTSGVVTRGDVFVKEGDIVEYDYVARQILRVRPDKREAQRPYGLSQAAPCDWFFSVRKTGVLGKLVRGSRIYGPEEREMITIVPPRKENVESFFFDIECGRSTPSFFNLHGYVSEYYYTGESLLNLVKMNNCCVDGFSIKRFGPVVTVNVRESLRESAVLSFLAPYFPIRDIVGNEVVHEHEVTWRRPLYYSTEEGEKMCDCILPTLQILKKINGSYYAKEFIVRREVDLLLQKYKEQEMLPLTSIKGFLKGFVKCRDKYLVSVESQCLDCTVRGDRLEESSWLVSFLSLVKQKTGIGTCYGSKQYEGLLNGEKSIVFSCKVSRLLRVKGYVWLSREEIEWLVMKGFRTRSNFFALIAKC